MVELVNKHCQMIIIKRHSSIPGLGRSGGGNGKPLQYSCLGNSMDKRSLAGYTVDEVMKELDTT